VRKYRKKDIIFISLAEDTPEQLIVFLVKTTFLFRCSNMKDYMNLTLQLNAFPTHFIINKDGSIAKVMSDYKSLEVALAKVSGKNNSSEVGLFL
jgi:hypothetical protein